MGFSTALVLMVSLLLMVMIMVVPAVDSTIHFQPLLESKLIQSTRHSTHGKSVSSVLLETLKTFFHMTTIKTQTHVPILHQAAVLSVNAIVPYAIFCTIQQLKTQTTTAILVYQVVKLILPVATGTLT